MNDVNPYDSPTERSSRGDRFWIGCVIGAAVCFALMIMLLVAAGFLAYFGASSTRPAPVPVAAPGQTKGGVEVPAGPERVEAGEMAD